MRLLRGLARIHTTFDDPHLVLRAGLVPVMALAERAGLGIWLGSMPGSADRVGWTRR